jgi:hypothetical protein
MAKKLAKKDYDKDGKLESPTDEYMGVKDRAIKSARGMKKTSSKRKKKVLKDSVEVSKFITAISSKNYAQANKYLKGIIEAKIQNRINSALNEPLF